MDNLFGKYFRYTFLFIFLAELISLSGFLLPVVNKAGFLIIISITLLLSLQKLEYGLLILFAELFIGSKGHLFYFEQGETLISLRIAIWLVVMSVWLGDEIIKWVKQKKIDTAFFHSSYFYYFLVLFLFIAWGLIGGLLNRNSLAYLLPDFKRWLFFATVFPAFSVFNDKDRINNLLQVFTSAITWLSLKTLFLLFVFSHNLIGMVFELYRWVRVTGVGEITQMPNGFSRIFFQSHVFVLAGFILFFLLFIGQIIYDKTIKEKSASFLLSAFYLSVILISFSRSFWAGLAVGAVLIFFGIAYLKIKNVITFRKLSVIYLSGLLSLVLSVAIIAIIVKFPYPKPTIDFSAGILSDRASEIYGEAGVSSRWALLSPLWDKIKESPIMGKGFGATVTYKTSDPRILLSSPTGEYTTFSFEWGWLDIWFKLGAFGLFAYLSLIFIIVYKSIKIAYQNMENHIDFIGVAVGLGLFIISVVSIFSPYMNYPLGIGYLIISALILNKILLFIDKKQNSA